MIENIEEKLSGQEPVNREELIELISSHGRKDSLITQDSIRFEKCLPKECYDLSKLDVSQIENLSEIFSFSYFNDDISNWDISNCTNVHSIFYSSYFNGDLSKWNISCIESLNWAFASSEFNNDSLKDWNTSNIKEMDSTFYSSKFNGSLLNWDVSNVRNMIFMFSLSKFNNDSLNNWNFLNIKTIDYMFYKSVFSGDISNWRINDNVNCYETMSFNFDFLKKYNEEKIITVNDFLMWLNDNKMKIKDINATKEEVLDFFNFNEEIKLENRN